MSPMLPAYCSLVWLGMSLCQKLLYLSVERSYRLEAGRLSVCAFAAAAMRHRATRRHLQTDGFILVVVGSDGKDEIGLFSCVATFVVGRTVFEEVVHGGVVVVSAEAEQEVRILPEHVVKVVGHVVVELFRKRHGMHGCDGAAGVGACLAYVLFYIVKVGDGLRVVVFECVGVEAYEMHKRGVEAEVVVAVYPVIDVFARAQAVVVAYDAHERPAETHQYLALPHKFFGEPEVRLVAKVNHKVNAVACIDVVYYLFGLVIPSLGVRDDGKAYLGLAPALLLYLGCHPCGQAGVSVQSCVVGVVFYHVAAPEEEGEDKEECGCPVWFHLCRCM